MSAGAISLWLIAALGAAGCGRSERVAGGSSAPSAVYAAAIASHSSSNAPLLEIAFSNVPLCTGESPPNAPFYLVTMQLEPAATAKGDGGPTTAPLGGYAIVAPPLSTGPFPTISYAGTALGTFGPWQACGAAACNALTNNVAPQGTSGQLNLDELAADPSGEGTFSAHYTALYFGAQAWDIPADATLRGSLCGDQTFLVPDWSVVGGR